MRLIAITLVSLLCAVPLAVFGEPGGSKQGAARPGPGDKSRERSAGRSGNEWWNEKVKEELEKFCQTNSPNRWKVIDAMPKGPVRESRVFAMGRQFWGLQLLKDQDHDLYEIKVKEIQVQDKEFGILQNPQKLSNDELKSKLRAVSQEYVQVRLDEREHRIKDLEKKLQSEKVEWENDKGKTTALVEDRIDMLIKQGASLFPTPGPHRGEGARNDSTRPARATTVNSAPNDSKDDK